MVALTHPSITESADGKLWFHENGTLWPGQAMAIEVSEILWHEKSKYQDVLVFKSATYGNVLVLDGVIQVTERDEFSYQEMIAHIPLLAHPCPKKVLVIGGGDGGVLREVIKHESVESVTLCEIDEAVVRLSKKFLPNMACGFDSDKVSVFIGDGFEFLKQKSGEYDVIITDSSDPVGPAESLFQENFFGLLKNALKPTGIICSQGECVWLHMDIISSLVSKVKTIFPVVDYAYTTIPTYPSGQIGFLLCSNDPSVDLRKARVLPEDVSNQLKYYHKDLHAAAFVLPAFAKRVIESSLQ